MAPRPAQTTRPPARPGTSWSADRSGRAAPPGHRGATAVLAAVNLAGALLLVLAGVGWGTTDPPRRYDTVLGVTRIDPTVSHLVSLAGLALVVLTWLGLGWAVRAGRVASAGVLATTAAGAVPLLAGPPLFSSDVWNYVAVGQLVDTGGDPYRQGWAAVARPEYLGRLSEFWRTTPSPYSPLALRLFQLVARVSGGDLDTGTLLLRAVALVAVAASVVLLVRLARATGARPAPALWLSVASPVVLLGGVSAVHIDVLVLPLVLAAAWWVMRRHPVLAGVAAGTAAQLKVTSLVVVAVVLAWAVLRERSPRRRAEAAATAAVAGGVFAVLTAVCGLGSGWLRSLDVPGRSDNSQTPIDALADLAHRAGLLARHGSVAVSGAPRWLETVALVVAAVLCLLVVADRRLGLAEAAGWAFTVVALLSGATWSWYLVVPVGLVAAAAPGRGRPARWGSLVVLVLLTTVGITPAGAPAASLQSVVGDVFYLVGYAVAAGLFVAGSIRTRRSRPVTDPRTRNGAPPRVR